MKNTTNRTETMSLLRIALQAMGLLLVLPTLVILYLFRDSLNLEKAPALICLLLAASLGYYLLWRVLRGIGNILTDLEKVSSGKAESLSVDAEATQLKEMAAIINALNRLAEEFRENAAQLENFIQQFATLAEITEITAHVPDIAELLRLVLRKAMASTHARVGSVWLLSEDGGGLDLVAAEGWTPKTSAPIPLADFLGRTVLETGMPMLVEDIEKSPLTLRPNDWKRYSTSSFLIMPLKTKNSAVGVVSLADKATGGTFHGQDQQFLSVLLGQMGYAVENARLLKQAREAASSLRKTIQIQESQLQEAQRKILQSEKLSALGQLAGGVAHDFNNLLQAILGYANLALNEVRFDGAVAHSLEQIRTAADRAAALTTQLLAFGRRQVLKPINLDLNRVIDEVMKMLHRVIGEHIRLEIIPGSRGVVHADPRQIEQVLINLCVNARDAMPNGGSLTIETRDVELGPAAQDQHPCAPPGRYVLLTVEDEGCGMDQETVQHVFEPFFTTKEVGKGTGLGLSMVYGIIRQHNGFVDVSSEPGKGSVFQVSLPATEGSADDMPCPQDSPDRKDAAPPQGAETILVAEDEEIIRDLTAQILQGAGYRVLLAADGQEAIELFENHAGEISLVLVDAVMPKKGGREVYNRVRAVRPKTPVLFCSGYGAMDLSSELLEEEGLQIIFKPIPPNDLLQKVREALDSAV